MNIDKTKSTAAPDFAGLRELLGLKYAIIGFYDVPTPDLFSDVVERRGCLYSSFGHWQQGKMTHISRARPGCLGSAYWLCGAQAMTHEDFLDFLVNVEGLKPTPQLMEQFLEVNKPYQMEYRHLLIGPLQPLNFQFCKTVTVFCNPDQLSALLLGVNYTHIPASPPRLLPSIGCGCYQIAGVFPSFEEHYAVVSSIDIAMRIHLPPDLISITMTPPLFAQMCEIDRNSFLEKPFWKRLVRLRQEYGET